MELAADPRKQEEPKTFSDALYAFLNIFTRYTRVRWSFIFCVSILRQQVNGKKWNQPKSFLTSSAKSFFHERKANGKISFLFSLSFSLLSAVELMEECSRLLRHHSSGYVISNHYVYSIKISNMEQKN